MRDTIFFLRDTSESAPGFCLYRNVIYPYMPPPPYQNHNKPLLRLIKQNRIKTYVDHTNDSLVL
jgi:hypothetical protein